MAQFKNISNGNINNKNIIIICNLYCTLIYFSIIKISVNKLIIFIYEYL